MTAAAVRAPSARRNCRLDAPAPFDRRASPSTVSKPSRPAFRVLNASNITIVCQPGRSDSKLTFVLSWHLLLLREEVSSLDCSCLPVEGRPTREPDPGR